MYPDLIRWLNGFSIISDNNESHEPNGALGAFGFWDEEIYTRDAISVKYSNDYHIYLFFFLI